MAGRSTAPGRRRGAPIDDEQGRLWFAHVGPSMNPTLARQDLLEVDPYRDGTPRVGDVVLFRVDDEHPLTVHRVVTLDADRFVTQGDNNDRVDPWRLGRGQIVGRVVAAWRGARRRPVVGGPAGQGIGVAVHALNRIDRATRRWLRPVYLALADRDLFARLLPSPLAPRVVWYHARGRQWAQLLLGRHVIGRLDDTHARWIVRRPFRLLLDPARLSVSPPPPRPRA